MSNLEEKVAYTLRIKPEIVRNAQMPETRLEKIYNTCSKAMFPKRFPFALSMTTMLCSMPVALWADEKAMIPFVASALVLPWAMSRAQEFENRKENIANQIAKKANAHGHSYPAYKGRLPTDISLAKSFRISAGTAGGLGKEFKNFGKEFKESFDFRNIKSTAVSLAPYLAFSALVLGLMISAAVMKDNAAEHVNDVRAKVDSLSSDQNWNFRLIQGPSLLSQNVYGKVKYKNDKGDDCTFEIERPLNFWGSKQIAPDKTSNICAPAP